MSSAVRWRAPEVSSSSMMRMRGCVTLSPTLRRSCDSIACPLQLPSIPQVLQCIIRPLPSSTNPMRKALPLLLAAAVLVTGCNVVYRQPVFQGTLLEKTNVEQLREGMTQAQVVKLLGTPAVSDPFHQERWDYVSSFKRRRDATEVKNLTLWFDASGALAKWEGEYFPEQDEALAREMRRFGNLPRDKDKGSGGR